MKTIVSLLIALATLIPATSQAADASTINRKVASGLRKLYASDAGARTLAKHAKAVLVFPNIIKAGFMFGGKFGEGALLERGYIDGYYSTVAASYGFQAGITEFGYAMFFMDDESLSFFKRSKGFEVGVGPTVVVADAAFSKSITSTTLQKGVYAFFFNQSGLMAGAGIQGTKITRIYPD